MLKTMIGIILGICYLSLVACGIKKDSDVSGIYWAEYEGNVDVLIILPNKEYTQSYPKEDGDMFINKNKWEYETLAHEKLGVTFNTFRFRGSQFGSNVERNSQIVGVPLKATRGFWHVEVENDIWGNIKLCFDPDLYKCFLKVGEIEKKVK